jgi:hypothetical protein
MRFADKDQSTGKYEFSNSVININTNLTHLSFYNAQSIFGDPHKKSSFKRKLFLVPFKFPRIIQQCVI